MKKVTEAYRDGVPRSSCNSVPELLNKITDVVLNYRPKAKKKNRKRKAKAKKRG